MTSPNGQHVAQGNILKRHLPSLNSEFSFSLKCCLNKIQESKLPHNLPIAGERIR